jgi:ATP-dependent RNA helicase DOB1
LTQKGRFSCELTTGDELVLTDMVFEGLFNSLSIEQTVAILSCFVHKEAQNEEGAVRMRADMQDILRKLQNIARNIAKVSTECLLACDEEEFVKSFNPGLIDVSCQYLSSMSLPN